MSGVVTRVGLGSGLTFTSPDPSRLNLLWTCTNDLIVGLALGSIIRENQTSFLLFAETFVRVSLGVFEDRFEASGPHSDCERLAVLFRYQAHVLGYLRHLLQWLSSWPVGIKLNDEIATVICRAFLGLSNLWEHGALLCPTRDRSSSHEMLTPVLFFFCSFAVCLEPILAHLPVGLMGWIGVFGASTLIGLIADFLSVLTLPFFACYVAAAFTFRHSFSMLRALFDVFRGEHRFPCPSAENLQAHQSLRNRPGRKYNPLRSRTEPATYEVDELLLGTILFVMLSAIFPTIAAFYLAFASVSPPDGALSSRRPGPVLTVFLPENWLQSRLLLLLSQACLITAIGTLNAFPLFMLLLRIKSPHRLPGAFHPPLLHGMTRLTF